MVYHMGGTPASRPPDDIDDDDGPPTLFIHEEDDDGYPNTPPVLERQDYYMENDDPEPEQTAIVIDEKPAVPNKWYAFKCEFYLPPKLRRLNPSRYLPHSQQLILDLICILCQRACNEAYAVSCFANHRFCKDCIFKREKHPFCPRCGDHIKYPPQPDPTYDEIIELMRFDKSRVNYVNLTPELDEDLSDSSHTSSEEDEAFKEKARSPVRPPRRSVPEERRALENFFRRQYEKRLKKSKSGSDADSEDGGEDHDDEPIRIPIQPIEERYPPYKYMDIHRLRDEYGQRKPTINLLVGQTTGEIDAKERAELANEPWMDVIHHENYVVIQPRWDQRNMKRPLQNMVYKTFWFNKDIQWPDNTPPTPPFGLTRSRLRDIKLMNKARKSIYKNPYLSKREKKISFHKFITEDLENNLVLSEFPSSPDDDDPPPKFCRTRFDYPSNYRKPRQDWRRLFDDNGRPKKSVKLLTGDRAKQLKQIKNMKNYEWKKQWGQPVMLIREASTKSAIGFKEINRMYLGVPHNACLGHLAGTIYKKISLNRNIKLELVKKRFLVNFHPVICSTPGNKMQIIKCDEEPKAEPEPPPPPPPAPIDNQQLQVVKGVANYRTLDGKTIPYPYGPHEPTARDVALKNLQQHAQRGYMRHQRRGGYVPCYQYKPRGMRNYQFHPVSREIHDYSPGPSDGPPLLTPFGTANPDEPGPSNKVLQYVKKRNSHERSPIMAGATTIPSQIRSSNDISPSKIVPLVARSETTMKTPDTFVNQARNSFPYSVNRINQEGICQVTARRIRDEQQTIERRNGTVNGTSLLKQQLKLPVQIQQTPLRPVSNGSSFQIRQVQMQGGVNVARAQPMCIQPITTVNNQGQLVAYSAPINGNYYQTSPVQAATIQGAPIQTMPGTSYQAYTIPNTNDDNYTIILCMNPHTRETQYMQITSDGRFLPMQTYNQNVYTISPPKTTQIMAGNGAPPTFLQPMKTVQGETYLQQVQPVMAVPPTPAPQPAKTQIGTSCGLQKKVTAFVTQNPLVILDQYLTIEQLCQEKNLPQGARLMLFYSIKDIKCEELVELPPPIEYPLLAREIRKKRKEKKKLMRLAREQAKRKGRESRQEERKKKETELEIDKAIQLDQKEEEEEEKKEERIEEPTLEPVPETPQHNGYARRTGRRAMKEEIKKEIKEEEPWT